MVDGILDFLAMILVLGIVTATSFNVTMPIVKEAEQMKVIEIYDKTASNIGGEQSNEYNGDGCMSYDEIILTVMSQSYFMPKPRVMDICDSKEEELLAIKAEQPDETLTDQEPSYDLDNAIEFVPNSVEMGNLVRNKLDAWYQKSELRGIPVDNLRFQLRYHLGETEAEGDNRYAIFVLHQRDSDEKEYLYRCDIRESNGLGKDPQDRVEIGGV